MYRERTVHLVLRTVMAAVFGIMSLVHPLVMAFAHAHVATITDVQRVAAHDHHHLPADMTQVADHHMHHQVPQKRSQPDPADCKIMCSGVGCLQTIEPPVWKAPLLHALVIERLMPAGEMDMRPALAEPDHPPPRFQS